MSAVFRAEQRVQAKPGSEAAELIADGAIAGVVKSSDDARSDGVPHVTVLTDDDMAILSPAADWQGSAETETDTKDD